MSQQPTSIPYIRQHKTVANVNQYALDKEVNELLAAGWMMHSPMFVAEGRLVVTLVKLDDRFTKLLDATLDMSLKMIEQQ